VVLHEGIEGAVGEPDLAVAELDRRVAALVEDAEERGSDRSPRRPATGPS
jgi:hypothetical protein